MRLRAWWRTAAVSVLLLAMVAWGGWSVRRSAKVDAVLATAEQALDRQDYQTAIRTLNEAPESARTDGRFQVLSARARDLRAAGERRPDAPAAPTTTDPLRGFRILIYPVVGNGAEKARAEVLERTLLAIVPADVEIRPQTRAFFDKVGPLLSDEIIGPALSDEIRFAESSMLDQRAARALQAILRDAKLGDFTLRNGPDRGPGTLSVMFAGASARPTSD